MLKIREYPDKGALYCEIISKAYLNRFKYKESEMLEVLNMERSSYYDRKKEAILLFGLSLWGTAIGKVIGNELKGVEATLDEIRYNVYKQNIWVIGEIERSSSEIVNMISDGVLLPEYL